MKENLISEDKISQIRDSLTGEAKEIFEKLTIQAVQSEALNTLKKFISQYESTDRFDVMMACVLGQMLRDMYKAISEEFKENKDEISSERIAYLLAKRFRDISQEIESANNVLRVVK